MKRLMLSALVLLSVAGGISLSAQMPDARQMSGIAMPVTDAAPGTVVVRVVRDSMTSNLPKHPVELLVGTTTLKATTDADGRAQFTGVTVNATARAVTDVDGKRVESEPFLVPAQGGIRLVLAGVAAGGTTAPAVPGKPGEVILGGDSRIQIEFEDDTLTVYYLLEFVNAGASPLSPASEVVFDLPVEAEQPTILEGSTTQASVRGHRVAVAGPFMPGRTPLQIGFTLPAGRADRTLVQAFPVPWAKVQVITTMLPGLTMLSSQFTQSGEVPGDNHTFLLGTGDALPAAQPLTVSLGGLPTRNKTGRYLAIVCALVILAGGGLMAFSSRRTSADAGRRAELEQRRTRLLTDLAKLERQAQNGQRATQMAARREELMTQLERVYGELDQHGASMGEGSAA